MTNILIVKFGSIISHPSGTPAPCNPGMSLQALSQQIEVQNVTIFFVHNEFHPRFNALIGL